MKLEFQDLDIEKNRELIIKFRADSFVVSFGNADILFGGDGKGVEQYLDVMRKRSQWKGSCVHAIYQGQIVGQIELRPGDNPDEGYVNLFYLRPDVRDSGFGIELDQYVEEFFRKHKMNCAYLNVSPTNARALRFYEKCGWVKQELITKSGTEVFVMKKIYS